jgi:hypothetical protein
MGSFVCSCAVGVCGSLGGKGSDLGAGKDKNSSVMVLSFCGVGSLGSKGGWYLGMDGDCGLCDVGINGDGLEFSDGISFGFETARIADLRWIGVFGRVDIKGGWDLGIASFGFASDQSLISARRWRLCGFGVVNGSGMVTDCVTTLRRERERNQAWSLKKDS